MFTCRIRLPVRKGRKWAGQFSGVIILGLLLQACQPIGLAMPAEQAASTSISLPAEPIVVENVPPISTPFPARPIYSPGELVDYIAQPGDTLPALAARFNTTVAEILAANSFIPASATTMPPGMPMQIPIYYQPFWGPQYQIIPDSLFVNGPAQIGFDTAAFIASQPGWLNGYGEYAFGGNRSAAQIIDYVAINFSISPRLLLTILEYQTGALTQPVRPAGVGTYILGHEDYRYRGLYLQLVWVANLLNDIYYQYRAGIFTEFEHLDGRLERIDPWQNAATVALQYYYSRFMDGDAYLRAVAHDGLALSYRQAFGDPWPEQAPHIPGSLEQPVFSLPFEPGKTWAYTGGPHTAYGTAQPFAALDFAPGAISGGCVPSDEWVTAVAAGVVARSELGTVMLDLDGDGDERTGWVVYYFHVATEGRVPVGVFLQTGDHVGHPSCEGGRTTGTHVHIARKYNGEWIRADGVLAFNLEGWVAHDGFQAYQGTLVRGGSIVTACECANADSWIRSTRTP
jgi:murein DD-endopeptidase MepM/ murein hydrolase activator NlpD